LRAVPEHPKFASLKRVLGLSKFEALGVLESLWHFTGKFAPRGNVGKFSNREIEDWVEWKGKPDHLIEALVETGWIDHHPDFRLIVHDWNVHADQTTKKQLGRTKERFAQEVSGYSPDMSSSHRMVSGPPEPVPEPVADPGPAPGVGSRRKTPGSSRDFRPISGYPQDLVPGQYAAMVLDSLNIVDTPKLRDVSGKAIKLLAKQEN